MSKAEGLKYFASLIEKETGIVYGSSNEHLLENRLRDLSKSFGFDDWLIWWNKVRLTGLNPTERELILDVATNNETSFFRDAEVFEFVKTNFAPAFAKENRFLRIWCAATSTGQEPYSLAMILTQLKEENLPIKYNIFSTDISERVLKQASSGIYSQLEVQRGLSAKMLLKFFEQLPAETASLPKYKIKRDLSAFINFKRLNLLDPWPTSVQFDIIFCRNVLIYQDVENKKRVISRLCQVLAPGGYLVLGGAESLVGLSQSFEMELYGKACVYKYKGSA